MKIRFWGVRGSIPAPGPETNRYGGNTSCVSVTTAPAALIIIDMGTGLMHLGNTLMAGDVRQGQGPRDDPALAHALGSHPGPRLLPAGVHRRQPVHGVGPRRLAEGARGHPRRPDGSELLAAADAQELLGDVRRPRRRVRPAVRSRRPARSPRASTRTARRPRSRSASKRPASVFVYASDVGYPGVRPAARSDRALPRRRRAAPRHDVSPRGSGDASQPRVLVVRRSVRRRDRGEGQAPRHVPLRPGLHRRRRRSDRRARARRSSTPHGIGVVPAREGDELEI